MRRFYKATLQAVGFNVFTANDGDACLTLLNRIRPAVIILDVDMPRVTGFQTLESIRRNHPHLNCPVIFSTIHQTMDSVTRAKALGAASFLVKPVDADTLIDRVSACLRPKGPSYVRLADD
ncbi:response regulator [Thalassobaculum sp.]